MKHHWLWISVLCAGCATQSQLVDQESTPTMIEIYERHAKPASTHLQLGEYRNESVATQHASEFQSPSLRNPVIHMYVYSHTLVPEGLRISGYWTSFELYEQYEFRMEGSVD